MTAKTAKEHKRQQAGIKAVQTKGQEELTRAARQAAYTRKHGKDDASNPFSRENYYKNRSPSTKGTS